MRTWYSSDFRDQTKMIATVFGERHGNNQPTNAAILIEAWPYRAQHWNTIYPQISWYSFAHVMDSQDNRNHTCRYQQGPRCQSDFRRGVSSVMIPQVEVSIRLAILSRSNEQEVQSLLYLHLNPG